MISCCIVQRHAYGCGAQPLAYWHTICHMSIGCRAWGWLAGWARGDGAFPHARRRADIMNVGGLRPRCSLHISVRLYLYDEPCRRSVAWPRNWRREIAMLIVFAAWSDQIAQYLQGVL